MITNDAIVTSSMKNVYTWKRFHTYRYIRIIFNRNLYTFGLLKQALNDRNFKINRVTII